MGKKNFRQKLCSHRFSSTWKISKWATWFFIHIDWVWPPPSNSNRGKWRFSSGLPTENVMSSWWSTAEGLNLSPTYPWPLRRWQQGLLMMHPSYGPWRRASSNLECQTDPGHVPSVKLTARPWKMMLGIWSFPFGARPIVRGFCC